MLTVPAISTGGPVDCSMSPRMADTKEDLPEPVEPTTATRLPSGIVSSASVIEGSPSGSQLKSPISLIAVSPVQHVCVNPCSNGCSK